MVYPNSKGTDRQKWWVWNGVTLRSQLHAEIEGTITETFEAAGHVQEDVDIDASLFTPPNDVTLSQWSRRRPSSWTIARVPHG